MEKGPFDPQPGTLPGSMFCLWRVSPSVSLGDAMQQPRDGRWHRAGACVIYASDTPALAALEALAHADGRRRHWLSCLALPREWEVEEVDRARLPSDWRRRTRLTRELGDSWLQAGRTPLLRVPSAQCPECWNYLVNPLACPGGSMLQVVCVREHRFDARLLPRAA